MLFRALKKCDLLDAEEGHVIAMSEKSAKEFETDKLIKAGVLQLIDDEPQDEGGTE